MQKIKSHKTFFKHLYTILSPQIMNKGNFMDETNLVVEGFKFMGLGMGTVFLFLIVMIGSMNLMSTVIHKFFPEPTAETNPSVATKQDNKKTIAAITAAITHHRQG